MKRSCFVTLLFIVVCMGACRHRFHQGRTSIQLKENELHYSMEANFNEDRTRAVQEYMNDVLGERNHMSFTNAVMDAWLTLDDHTHFYIYSYPGELNIKFNKHENSTESYNEIKQLCEGLKGVMGGKGELSK